MKKKLVSLKEAVVLVNEAFGNNPEKSGRDVVSIKTIYNALCAKKIKRYGSTHFRQVDVSEILNLFGPKQSAS